MENQSCEGWRRKKNPKLLQLTETWAGRGEKTTTGRKTACARLAPRAAGAITPCVGWLEYGIAYSIPRVGISPGLYDLEKKIGCRAFSRKTQTDLSVRKAHTTHLKSYYKVRKRTQQICINRTLLENSSRNLMKLSNKNFLYTVT